MNLHDMTERRVIRDALNAYRVEGTMTENERRTANRLHALYADMCESPEKYVHETSRKAHLDNLPRAGGQRRRCLIAVIDAGTNGLTADAVALHLNLSTNSVSKRMGELEVGGWVAVSPDHMRKTRSGSMARVYHATGKALTSRNLFELS